MAKYEQAAKEIKENKPKTIVGEVFENGYLKKHGDHYHFVFGTPPSDAIYEQKKQISQSNHSDDDYVFNPKDIVSENELGFVVRHGDHYHFIYRSQLANAQTVTREDETGKKRTCKLLRIPHGDHFHDVLDCGDGTAHPCGAQYGRDERGRLPCARICRTDGTGGGPAPDVRPREDTRGGIRFDRHHGRRKR